MPTTKQPATRQTKPAKNGSVGKLAKLPQEFAESLQPTVGQVSVPRSKTGRKPVPTVEVNEHGVVTSGAKELSLKIRKTTKVTMTVSVAEIEPGKWTTGYHFATDVGGQSASPSRKQIPFFSEMEALHHELVHAERYLSEAIETAKMAKAYARKAKLVNALDDVVTHKAQLLTGWTPPAFEPETIEIPFSEAARCAVTIELARQPDGVWYDRVTQRGWCNSISELFGEHCVGRQTHKDAALACAFDRLRERWLSIADGNLDADQKSRRSVSLDDLELAQIQLLGTAAEPADPRLPTLSDWRDRVMQLSQCDANGTHKTGVHLMQMLEQWYNAGRSAPRAAAMLFVDRQRAAVIKRHNPGLQAGCEDFVRNDAPRSEEVALPFETREIAISEIKFRSDNPRGSIDQANVERLKGAIAAQGLQAPIGVLQTEQGFEGWYGNHRFEACRSLGWSTIRANVYPIGTDPGVLRESRADDNLAHGELNPIARAMHWREKLIARGWQPDGSGGPSLRALSQQLGISQGELSNQMSLLELPEDWIRRLISGEITPTQGRMLSPWRDRPPVLQEVAKRIRRHGTDGDLTTSGFEGELRIAVFSVSRPTKAGAYLRHDSKTMRRHDVAITAKEIAANKADLDLVTIGSGRQAEVRAFNVKLFDALQTAAEKRQDEATKTTRDAGDGKAAKKALTPTEKRAKAKKQAEQLAKRVALYKTRWLQAAAAKRIQSINNETAIRLLLYFAAIDGEMRAHEMSETVVANGGKRHGGREWYQLDAWKTLGTLPVMRLLPAARQFLAMRLQANVESSRCGLRTDDIPAIAAELGVDFAIDWRCDESFLLLFTTSQLEDLVSEWKIVPMASGKRSDLIASILEIQTNRGKPFPVPKVLAKAE